MRETGPFLGATELSMGWRCGKRSSCQLGRVVVLVLRGDILPEPSLAPHTVKRPPPGGVDVATVPVTE